MKSSKLVAKAYRMLEKRFNEVLHSKTSWRDNPGFRLVLSLEKIYNEMHLSCVFKSRTTFHNVVTSDGHTPIVVPLLHLDYSEYRQYTLRTCNVPHDTFKAIWLEAAVGKDVYLFKHKVLASYETVESLALAYDLEKCA